MSEILSEIVRNLEKFCPKIKCPKILGPKILEVNVRASCARVARESLWLIHLQMFLFSI